jgi:uncharacterized protein YrrD
MKKTQEIIGLPIISISDGIEVGKVKSIIINADKGAIDYIVVDSGIQILSARVIPTDNVLGIGEYALTIENDNAINDISKIPAAIDLLQKNIQVKGTKVLTKKGRLIGEIGDIYVDEDECCKIMGVEYIADITQKRIRLIPRKSVITFGKNLVVVSEDVESNLVDKVTELASGENTLEAEKKNLTEINSNDDDHGMGSFTMIDPIVYSEPAVVNVPHIEKIVSDSKALYKENRENESGQDTAESADFLESLGFNVDNQNFAEADSADTSVSEEVFDIGERFPVDYQADTQDSDYNGKSKEESNAASLFEQRQRQYLYGRRTTKTITDNDGNVIVTEGMLIDNEIIDSAKMSEKLIELVMNNKA